MTNDLKEVRNRVAALREIAAKKSAETDNVLWDTYASAYDIVLEIISDYQ